VDGSHASGEYNSGDNGQVPTENHIYVRCTQKNLDRQWYTVQMSKVHQMLRGIRYPASAIICSAPADEWVSRASQWTNHVGNED
jgi:hypothetical protein